MSNVIGAPKHAPPFPDGWTDHMRMEVERLLAKHVKRMQDDLAGLVDFYQDRGERLGWQERGRREWILARLAERLYPFWPDLKEHRIGYVDDAGTLGIDSTGSSRQDGR